MADKYNFRRARVDEKYRSALFEVYGGKAERGYKRYVRYQRTKPLRDYANKFGKESSLLRKNIQAKRTQRTKKFNSQFKKTKKGKGLKRPTIQSVFQSIKPKGKRRDPFLDFIRG